MYFFRFSLERADRNDSCRIWDCLDEILLSASFHIYFFISQYVRKCVSSIFVCNLISNVRSNYVSDVFFFMRKLLLQNDSYYLRRYANNSCPVFRHPTIYLIRKRIWRQTSLVIIERLICFIYKRYEYSSRNKLYRLTLIQTQTVRTFIVDEAADR